MAAEARGLAHECHSGIMGIAWAISYEGIVAKDWLYRLLLLHYATFMCAGASNKKKTIGYSLGSFRVIITPDVILFYSPFSSQKYLGFPWFYIWFSMASYVA